VPDNTGISLPKLTKTVKICANAQNAPGITIMTLRNMTVNAESAERKKHTIAQGL